MSYTVNIILPYNLLFQSYKTITFIIASDFFCISFWILSVVISNLHSPPYILPDIQYMLYLLQIPWEFFTNSSSHLCYNSDVSAVRCHTQPSSIRLTASCQIVFYVLDCCLGSLFFFKFWNVCRCRKIKVYFHVVAFLTVCKHLNSPVTVANMEGDYCGI